MDIDIDLPQNTDIKKLFPQAIKASIIRDNILTKHPAGHYLQPIPTDSITGLAAIPYDKAEAYGFLKIDFLHLNLLNQFESKNQIRELLKKQIDWSLLEKEDVVRQLFQIHNQFDLINRVKPKSIMELADCLALIRPGKRYLLNDYMKNKTEIRKKLYTFDDEAYSFKKSHSISYAVTIILQLNCFKYENQTHELTDYIQL